MEFSWDEHKNRVNFKKPGITKPSKIRLSEIECLPENAIDTSDIPELDDDFWENTRRIVPENYLQIEHEILEWFKGQRQDYHEQINTVLRMYMEVHRYININHDITN